MGHTKAESVEAHKEANMENQRDSGYHVERESSGAIGTCGEGMQISSVSRGFPKNTYALQSLVTTSLVSILKSNNNTEWAIDKDFIGIISLFEPDDAKVE